MVAANILAALVDPSALVATCIKHRVRTIRLFGSFARGQAAPSSDVDLLVEFEPGIDPDLFELGGLQQDLSDIFGRVVDLKTPEMFTPDNLKRVVSSSIVGYAA